MSIATSSPFEEDHLAYAAAGRHFDPMLASIAKANAAQHMCQPKLSRGAPCTCLVRSRKGPLRCVDYTSSRRWKYQVCVIHFCVSLFAISFDIGASATDTGSDVVR